MENFKNEIWKPVVGYEGLYEVSSYGRIRSLKRKVPHIMKPFNNGYGYLKVSLNNNGQKTFFVHRLIAETFIPNPNNLPTVDHIDRNKMNNCIENLRWINQIGQAKNRNNKSNWGEDCRMPIRCVETNQIFENSAAAAHWISNNDLSKAKISYIAITLRRVCKENYGFKSAYGYHWEFVMED